MAEHRNITPLHRRDLAIAAVAFAAAMSIGPADATAESRRPSQPVTVNRPPAWVPRQGRVGFLQAK